MIEQIHGYANSLSHLPVWRVALAGLYCETDQLDEARTHINILADHDFKIPMDWTWASVVISLAQVCADLDDRDLATASRSQFKNKLTRTRPALPRKVTIS